MRSPPSSRCVALCCALLDIVTLTINLPLEPLPLCQTFQLKYAPRAWKQERLVWTSVVQLNLIKNVNNIHRRPRSRNGHSIRRQDRFDQRSHVSLPAFRFSLRSTSCLKLRLAPLRGVQTDLESASLGAARSRIKDKSGADGLRTLSVHFRAQRHHLPPWNPPQARWGGRSAGSANARSEFYIRSNNSWKDRFRNGLKNASRPPYSGPVGAKRVWGLGRCREGAIRG
jgi:hypothetical protein